MISDAEYERAVNLAASLAWYFSTQDAEVSFVVTGQGRGTDLNEFLAGLAVIEPQGTAKSAKMRRSPITVIPDVLREIGSSNSAEYNIVLTARPRGSLPTSLWNSSYFVFLGAEGRAVPSKS